jgi:hypothetical protein
LLLRMLAHGNDGHWSSTSIPRRLDFQQSHEYVPEQQSFAGRQHSNH